MPSVGVSALIEVQDLHEAWDGDLLAASLKAQSLYRIRRWGGGFYTEQIHVGDRIRDLEIVNGVLLLGTDSGKVLVLDPVQDLANTRTATGLVTNKNALAECGKCHNLASPRSTDFGPHLVNVMSRQVASLEDFSDYSDGLKGRSEMHWTAESIREFLASPAAFAPGSKMPQLELTEAEIDETVDLLPLLR